MSPAEEQAEAEPAGVIVKGKGIISCLPHPSYFDLLESYCPLPASYLNSLLHPFQIIPALPSSLPYKTYSVAAIKFSFTSHAEEAYVGFGDNFFL